MQQRSVSLCAMFNAMIALCALCGSGRRSVFETISCFCRLKWSCTGWTNKITSGRRCHECSMIAICYSIAVIGDVPDRTGPSSCLAEDVPIPTMELMVWQNGCIEAWSTMFWRNFGCSRPDQGSFDSAFVFACRRQSGDAQRDAGMELPMIFTGVGGWKYCGSYQG